MDANTATMDLESGKSSYEHNAEKPASALRGVVFLEAAALLTIWSILVINEGAVRFIDSNPAAGLSGGRPAVMLVFLGGLFEVVFGLIGLFLGIAAFIVRAHNTVVTKAAMVIQTILGYYVFVIFVFVIPAFRAADLASPSLVGLTLGQSRFLIALGVLTSFQFCLALQGGQFIFMARLVCAATGKDFLMQNSGARMRAVFWNANLGLAGVWTLITGILINVNVGSGTLDMPFESPPNVGRLPGMTIFTGLTMIVFAAVGIMIAVMKMQIPRFYFPTSGFVYLFAFLNYTIVQFGLLDGAPAGAVALHAGLVFLVVFLGPYFVHLASKEQEAQDSLQRN